MPREIWPYLRAPLAAFEFGPWMLTADGEVQELPEYLEGWDPLTNIAAERVIRCDVGAVRSAAGLRADVPLVLTVSWMNRQSFMTERLYREPLDSEQTIRITLPAARLGGSVVLTTTATVATTDPQRPLGSARWAGSVLAADERVLVLEGDGPMFPISSVDFAVTKYSANASWALQLPEDLSLPVLGSVLLLVNTRDGELNAALGASKPDARQSALLDELENGLGTHLLVQSIDRREELESEDWPDQTVGSLLFQYLDIAKRHHVASALASGDAATISAVASGTARAEGFGRRFK